MRPLKLHADLEANNGTSAEAIDPPTDPLPSSKRAAALLTAGIRPQLEPLLIDARELGRLLSISTATVWRLKAAGKLPRAKKLGSQIVRWDAAEIRRWVEAGMPDLKTWEALKRR